MDVLRHDGKRNDILRRLRVEVKGWTKQDLAREAGVSTQTIRKAERGQEVSEVSQARIAKALGVDVRSLFGSPAGTVAAEEK